MKKASMFSLVMAVVMFVSAILPVAPVAALTSGAAFNALPETTMSVQTGRGNYGCTLIRQSPPDWYRMTPRQDFDAFWTIQNSGNAVWPSNQTKFRYLGGTKFQTRGNEFNLDSSIGLGKKLKIGVDMVAPRTPGIYSTTWALYAGNTRFCIVTLVIRVTR